MLLEMREKELIQIDEVLNEKNNYVSMIADLKFTVEKVEEDRIKKVVPTNEPYVYLSCRVQDDINKAIEKIKKHTKAFIIKR